MEDAEDRIGGWCAFAQRFVQLGVRRPAGLAEAHLHLGSRRARTHQHRQRHRQYRLHCDNPSCDGVTISQMITAATIPAAELQSAVGPFIDW